MARLQMAEVQTIRIAGRWYARIAGVGPIAVAPTRSAAIAEARRLSWKELRAWELGMAGVEAWDRRWDGRWPRKVHGMFRGALPDE